MATFVEWMVLRDAATLLHLLEAAEYFNPSDYDPVFDSELTTLIRRLPDGEAKQQAMAMMGGCSNYIVRSLQRSGFRDDDVQEHFHQIVVKLLVSPGRLLAGWEPERNPNLQNRFRRSVWNAIRNAQEKTRNRRRWMPAARGLVLGKTSIQRFRHSSGIFPIRHARTFPWR